MRELRPVSAENASIQAQEHSPAPSPNIGPKAENLPSSASGESRGEKLFDWLTYGGFAGVATFLLSLPLGYWARYSPSGEQAIRWTAGHLGKAGLSLHAAEDVVMTTALMQGGNVALLGVKAMENRKPQLVTALNRHLGEKADELAADEITVEKEPKQTWASLSKSRLIAWAAVFASLRGAAHVLGKERFDRFEEAFATHAVCGPLRRATHVNGKETTLFKLGRIGATDGFATAAAAGLLYVGSRVFAEKIEEDSPAKLPLSAAAKEAKPHADRFTPALSHIEMASRKPAENNELASF
ncbi:MAG: hypothetical protein JO089_06645 [Alphaproteobacteria bacterium]|nr:hypothetical protein [Alphaproteobacteria bacterium]